MIRLRNFASAFCVAAAVLVAGAANAGEPAVKIPAPASDESAGTAASETAVLAGGCFWGVQAVFQHTKGVTQVVSGYAGGSKDTASYHTVSGGNTGHAESVKITFDPRQVSYGTLLQIYFSVAHNPTELNFQGPDRGTQYRSAIFTLSEAQAKIARDYIAQLDAARVYPNKIVTQVSPLKGFYDAEFYHQNYLTLHPREPYIVYYDLPKLANLKTMFPMFYREDAVLVTGSAAD